MTEDSDEEGHHVTQTTYAAAPVPVQDPYATMPVGAFKSTPNLVQADTFYSLPLRLKMRTGIRSQALIRRKLKSDEKSSKKRKKSTTKRWKRVMTAEERERRVRIVQPSENSQTVSAA
jgi:hypothetical protein